MVKDTYLLTYKRVDFDENMPTKTNDILTSRLTFELTPNTSPCSNGFSNQTVSYSQHGKHE